MAWHVRVVETVDSGDQNISETNQMWRQIDSMLYYKMKQAIDA